MNRIRSFSRQGLTFEVDDQGPVDGECVVLLHGFPQTRTSWAVVADGLAAAGYRTLAVDQRGYSPEARPPRRHQYRRSSLVDDVLALAERAGAERFHVVGHDWGGAVAWVLGGSRPQRLATVTVLSTPHPRAFARSLTSSTQLLRSWYMAFFQLPWVPEAVLRLGGGAVAEHALARSGLPPDRARQYARHLQEPGGARGALNWYRAIPFDGPGASTRVAVPTLYLYSEGDTALTRRAAELTGEWVSGPYEFHVLDGVSHWIPETAPDRILEVLVPFLGRYPAQARESAGSSG